MTTEQIAALLKADAAAVLEHDRRRYIKQITQAAELIAANREVRPVILLSGPSGSGKTTTALLIERELERMGMETHTLSMDDYFSPLSPADVELMNQGKLDLETPNRVDSPFFQEQLGQILEGKEVSLPRYDFFKSSRVFDGRTLRRKPGELVIMEGIHALNPAVTGYSDHTTRLYVSVRTRITAQDSRVLHPSMIRLARRLLRDYTTRGRAMTGTIRMRGKVDEGEQMYIMPFKQNAHFSIDSFYSAELSVYRLYLFESLVKLLPEYPELEDLLCILSELPEVDENLVPKDSLLREFIGGSELEY